MSTTTSRDRLLRLLDPAVSAVGLDLESVEVTPAGRRRVLRVVVDRDGGVSMDDVAEATRRVSAALDDADAMGAAPYVLEVSSPGVDRPLREPRHWRRAAGRLVHVTLADGGTLTGRVRAAGDGGVTVDVDGDEQLLEWTQVRRGEVQVEFRRDDDEEEV